MVCKWLLLYPALLLVTGAEDYASNPSVRLFREYLRINTTTYNDLSPAVEFWQEQAAALGLPIEVHEFEDGFPVLVITWQGTDPSLGAIMLNSHMDVVPAPANDGWTYPPFSAHLDEDGVIWARGSQDMKSVGIQYYEALRRLKKKHTAFLRTVYMTLMPDEEVGGPAGMQQLLQSEKFASMNVGFELDEGTSYDIPFIPLFYQDKVVWQIQVDCHGIAGHGSTFSDNNSTATGKCLNVMNTMMSFRQQEYEKSLTADITNAGGYTSVNLNKINGGIANNVIPDLVTLVFDIRLGTTVDETAFAAQLDQMVTSAGPNVTLTYLSKDLQSPATLIGTSNPYYLTAASVATQLNITVVPIIPPGSTDARFVRGSGIPAFGFSPMPNTELLLHSVNERLSAATFLRGIDIYETLIPALANIPGNATSPDPSVYIVRTAVSTQ